MNIDRDFEKFQGGATPPKSERVHVSINEHGRIILNERIYEAIGKPEAVYLHFSRTRDVIALEPTRLRMPAAFPVFRNRAAYRINAAPFCRHFGIRIEGTERFTAPSHSSDGRALMLSLRDTVRITRAQ